MAMSKDDAVEFYDGQIRVQSPNGETLSEFHSKDYMTYVEEKRLQWTYAKLAYLKNLGWPEGIVQVGPTARINVNKRATTPFANRELENPRMLLSCLTYRA
jgi:F420-non-reducing hydrogenase large subunit